MPSSIQLTTFCRVRPDLRASDRTKVDARCLRVLEEIPGAASRARSRAAGGNQRSPSRCLSPVGAKQGLASVQFDTVWSNACTSQHDMFTAMEPQLRTAMQHRGSCTVLAYGPPGAGKTNSMLGSIGDPRDQGLVPRAISLALEERARCIGDGSALQGPAVTASFFELVGDRFLDLAGGEAAPAATGSVRRVAAGDGHVAPEGVSVVACQASVVRLLSLYLRGLERRSGSASMSCFQFTVVLGAGTSATLRFFELGTGRPAGASLSRVGPKVRGGKPLTPSGKSTAPLSRLEQAMVARLRGEDASATASPLAGLLAPCLDGEQPLIFLLCARLDEPHVPSLVATLRLPNLLQQLAAARPTRRDGKDEAPVRQDSAAEGLSVTIGAAEEDVFTTKVSQPGSVTIEAEPVARQTSAQSPMVRSPSAPHLSSSSGSECATEAQILQSCIMPCLDERRNTMAQLAKELERTKSCLRRMKQNLENWGNTRKAFEGPCQQETNLKILIEKVNRDMLKQEAALDTRNDLYREFLDLCSGQQASPLDQSPPAYPQHLAASCGQNHASPFPESPLPAVSSFHPSLATLPLAGPPSATASPISRGCSGSRSVPIIPRLPLGEALNSRHEEVVEPSLDVYDDGSSSSSVSDNSLSSLITAATPDRPALASVASAPALPNMRTLHRSTSRLELIDSRTNTRMAASSKTLHTQSGNEENVASHLSNILRTQEYVEEAGVLKKSVPEKSSGPLGPVGIQASASYCPPLVAAEAEIHSERSGRSMLKSKSTAALLTSAKDRGAALAGTFVCAIAGAAPPVPKPCSGAQSGAPPLRAQPRTPQRCRSSSHLRTGAPAGCALRLALAGDSASPTAAPRHPSERALRCTLPPQRYAAAGTSRVVGPSTVPTTIRV